jgi:hypothetical protein
MKKQTISNMLDDLDEIHKQIIKDPNNVPKKVKKRFWKIVGQIKRTSNPDKKLVAKASKIRDLLYKQKYGGSIPLWLTLPIWFALGIVCLSGFIYSFVNDVWGGIDGYRHGTIWWTMVCFYPFGRLIAGRFTGIEFDGLALTYYIFPTLRTNYPSYLTTSPPKRQWFFFFAGAWTVIITGVLGIIGYIATGDKICLLPVTILIIGETISGTGILGKWGAEMGNFHRERRIARDWRRLTAQNKK